MSYIYFFTLNSFSRSPNLVLEELGRQNVDVGSVEALRIT